MCNYKGSLISLPIMETVVKEKNLLTVEKKALARMKERERGKAGREREKKRMGGRERRKDKGARERDREKKKLISMLSLPSPGVLLSLPPSLVLPHISLFLALVRLFSSSTLPCAFSDLSLPLPCAFFLSLSPSLVRKCARKGRGIG